jgi:hypothetical protein
MPTGCFVTSALMPAMSVSGRSARRPRPKTRRTRNKLLASTVVWIHTMAYDGSNMSDGWWMDTPKMGGVNGWFCYMMIARRCYLLYKCKPSVLLELYGLSFISAMMIWHSAKTCLYSSSTYILRQYAPVFHQHLTFIFYPVVQSLLYHRRHHL